MGENSINNIYDDIRKKIISQYYYPGQKLSENKLAKEYSCSRTPIREVLKKLENQNLVIIKSKSGTYVRHETSKNYIDILYVRSYLERLAYKLALQNASNKEILKLESIIKELERIIRQRPINTKKLSEFHYKFHQMIVMLSGNEVLLKVFNLLNFPASHMFRENMDIEGRFHIIEYGHALVSFAG